MASNPGPTNVTEELISHATRGFRRQQVSFHGRLSLSNEMHPLLDSKRFTDDFNHEDTTLARRFASRFLQTDSLLPFWWTLFESECRKVLRSTAQGDTRYYLPEPPETLSPVQLQTTKEILNNLSNFVTFQVSKDEKEKSPFTKCAYSEFPPTPCSVQSTITIPQRYLDDLHADLQLDEVCRATASVCLGNIFLHELVHAAAAGWRLKSDKQAVYFGEDEISEDGFAFEKRMFGGVYRVVRQQPGLLDRITYSLNEKNGPAGYFLYLEDWPNLQIVDELRKHNALHDIRDRHKRGPFNFCVWQAMFGHPMRLLLDKFWDESLSQKGVAALRPRKEVAFIMGYSNRTVWEPLRVDNVRPSELPQGYKVSPDDWWLYHPGLGRAMAECWQRESLPGQDVSMLN